MRNTTQACSPFRHRAISPGARHAAAGVRRRITRHRVVSTVAVLCAATAVTCAVFAGPMVPTEKPIPEEARTLAGLTTLGVKLDLQSEELEAAGLDELTVTNLLLERLDTSGLETTDHPDAPKLNVVLLSKTHPNHKDILSMTYELAVHQQVVIPRSGHTVHAPTYTLVFGALIPKNELRDTVNTDLRNLTDFVLGRIVSATETVRNAEKDRS